MTPKYKVVSVVYGQCDQIGYFVKGQCQICRVFYQIDLITGPPVYSFEYGSCARSMTLKEFFILPSFVLRKFPAPWTRWHGCIWKPWPAGPAGAQPHTGFELVRLDFEHRGRSAGYFKSNNSSTHRLKIKFDVSHPKGRDGLEGFFSAILLSSIRRRRR